MNYIGITRKMRICAIRILQTNFDYLIASWSNKSFCRGTLHIFHLLFTSHVKVLKHDNLKTVDRTVFGPGSLSFRRTIPDVLICYSTYLLLLLGEKPSMLLGSFVGLSVCLFVCLFVHPLQATIFE